MNDPTGHHQAPDRSTPERFFNGRRRNAEAVATLESETAAAMIDIEELDALDLTIWLGRGQEAARRLGCNQSTVSRRSNHCLKVFDLQLHRDAEGWPRTRGHELLLLERQVHQLHRLQRGSALRLDTSLLAAPLLRDGTPIGWMTGTLDCLGWQRPLRLVKERILDAWITAMGQELTTRSAPDVLCVPLLITPLQLACAPASPLLLQGQLTLHDVAGLPRLAPRRGSYSQTEHMLGPWREQHRPLTLETGPRRKPESAEGFLPDQVLHYGTRFSLAHQGRFRALPLELGVQCELTLVLRRDVSDQPAILQLIETLQQRAERAAITDLGIVGRN